LDLGLRHKNPRTGCDRGLEHLSVHAPFRQSTPWRNSMSDQRVRANSWTPRRSPPQPKTPAGARSSRAERENRSPPDRGHLSQTTEITEKKLYFVPALLVPALDCRHAPAGRFHRGDRWPKPRRSERGMTIAGAAMTTEAFADQGRA